MLKLLFHHESLELLAVHVIGESATEIVHIGQAVIALGGTIEYFRDNVFNYPTMAEAYKVAAFDGLNKISLVAAALADYDCSTSPDTLNSAVAMIDNCLVGSC